MGPVWDLDIAMGWNADKFGADFTTPQGWKVRNMSFYACLFEHEDFVRAVCDMYWNGGVREAMYDALERYKLRYGEMAEDGRLNYRRWQADWPALALRMGENGDGVVEWTMEWGTVFRLASNVPCYPQTGERLSRRLDAVEDAEEVWRRVFEPVHGSGGDIFLPQRTQRSQRSLCRLGVSA